MKKMFSIALLGAFLAATNIGCGDSKPAPKATDGKEGPAGRSIPAEKK